MLGNFDGQHTDDIIGKGNKAYHVVRRRGWRIRTQKGVVALTVLVDLIGHSFDAPILAVYEFTFVVRKYGAKMFDD